MVKDSRKDTGISLQNSVLKQAKMVTIYQRNNTITPKNRAAINNSIDCKGFPEDWEEQRKMFGVK